MTFCEREWKEGGYWQERKEETARRRTQGLLKKTARKGTLKPQIETAWVRTQELLKETATFQGRSHQVERWRIQEKRKEEKWKKRKKRKKKEKEEGEVQKKEMVEEVQRAHHKFVYDKNEERQKEEGKQKTVKNAPKRRHALGKFGKWLFLFLIVGQTWLSVCAEAEGPLRRTEAVMRMQQEVQIKENRWTEATSKRWRQSIGKDRTEMKKEARRLRCTLLNGSALSTQKKFLRRYTGKCDIFFGLEHRLRKEEMEEQFNREIRS